MSQPASIADTLLAVPSPVSTKCGVGIHGKSSAREAAGEFEALLMGQWLQSAQSSFATVPGGTDEDAGGEQMKAMAVQSLAKSMVAMGGIGLSRLLSGYLDKRQVVSQEIDTQRAQQKDSALGGVPGVQGSFLESERKSS